MGLDSVGQAWIYDYRSACPSFEVLCGVRGVLGAHLDNYGYAFTQPRALAGARDPWKPCRRRYPPHRASGARAATWRIRMSNLTIRLFRH